MRIFHCDHCQELVFFENVQCLTCGHTLAYLHDVSEVGSLEPSADGLFRALGDEAEGRQYRLCQNYAVENVCNWAVPADDPNPLCPSCRLTRVIPTLDRDGRREKWFALELAKRRTVYGLLSLGLPVAPKKEDEAHGLAFEFLADPDLEPVVEGEEPGEPPPPVLTGHADGVIVINIAEADDAEREKRRMAMHEPYRTLLGHFRHEVGHYYWDRLIRDGAWLEPFRELFGDDREDYAAAIARHYEQGPPADWQTRFVSAYASSHPWEDWAETWAHYLHMTDTLETASECGLTLRPSQSNMPVARPRFSLRTASVKPFDTMMKDWLAVTYMLNNLNRGLGQRDSYPFVLAEPTIDKLRFVHKICSGEPPEPTAAE